jgi:hypothetical protein
MFKIRGFQPLFGNIQNICSVEIHINKRHFELTISRALSKNSFNLKTVIKGVISCDQAKNISLKRRKIENNANLGQGVYVSSTI